MLRGGRGRTGRAATPLLVVHRCDRAGGDRPPRVGFVVPKAVGNAVVRHRVTRRLRAVMAARLRDLPAGTDLVVRANPAAARASSAEFAVAVDGALRRLGTEVRR